MRQYRNPAGTVPPKQMNLQDQYDDALFDFSTGNFDSAIAKLTAILTADPTHFDAQLSLGMAYYRKGDFATAIAEGPGQPTPTASDPELALAKPKPPPMKPPEQFPAMPWKKK